MGMGSYTAADWGKLKESRGLESATTNQIFKNKEIDPRFDPKFIGVRESRDSLEHPNSTPIIIGLDVTGSMGYLSHQIAKESLNELMQSLYSIDYIKDPQLLFAAIGDVVDSAPLQVTQFESDIRIAEQLMDLWLEGMGGDRAEDFELLWYFAANHTDVDSFNKRNQKGVCITIGDADCHDSLSSENIEKIFNDRGHKDCTSEALSKEASEKYELFHINLGSTYKSWDLMLPGRIVNIEKSDVRCLPEIIISLIQLTRGIKRDDILSQWGELTRDVVSKAIAPVFIGDGDKFVF